MNEGRLADRAYTGIVEMINSDGLEVGDRLPSEARLAEILSPIRAMVSARGPTKVTPAPSSVSAKPAFSDRKP